MAYSTDLPEYQQPSLRDEFGSSLPQYSTPFHEVSQYRSAATDNVLFIAQRVSARTGSSCFGCWHAAFSSQSALFTVAVGQSTSFIM